MTKRRLHPVFAVPAVLAPHPRDRFARAVAGGHPRQADQTLAAGQKAPGHLGVLVARPALVPASVLEQRCPLPHAGEHPGVELVLHVGAAAGSGWVGLPFPRSTATQRRPQRQRHGARDRTLTRRHLRTADPARATAPADARPRARDSPAGRRCGRPSAPPIAPVRDASAMLSPLGVSRRGLSRTRSRGSCRASSIQDRARSVGRPAVHEHELEPARKLLLEHRGNTGPDVTFLIQNRHEHRAINPARPVALGVQPAPLIPSMNDTPANPTVARALRAIVREPE